MLGFVNISMQKTGEWDGLVRGLLNETADMVITSLKITPERNSVIDFSVPFLETGITIIVAIRDGAVSPKAFLGECPGVFKWLLKYDGDAAMTIIIRILASCSNYKCV